MKKITLELGGNDPFVVLEDANLEEAVKLAARARLGNTGQICINSKRFIIHEKLYDQFLDNLVKEVEANYKFADPKEESTVMGPCGRQDFAEKISK